MGSLIDLSGFGSAAEALVNRFSNAVGRIYEPTHLRRMAAAEVDVNKARAVADLDLTAELADRAHTRNETKLLRQQKNIDAVVLNTLKALPEDAHPERIDIDWLDLFIDQCQNVSDEAMQSLWSRVLASEAVKAGSFRRRTLGVVASLEQFEAERFTQLCQFVWNIGERNEPIIFFDFEAGSLSRQGLTNSNLRNLESAGLIVFTPGRPGSIRLPSEPKPFEYFGKTYLIGQRYAEHEVSHLETGNVQFTGPGHELFAICGAQANESARDQATKHWRKGGIVVSESASPS